MNIANCQLHHKWVTMKIAIHPIYLLIFECIIEELNEGMKAKQQLRDSKSHHVIIYFNI